MIRSQIEAQAPAAPLLLFNSHVSELILLFFFTKLMLEDSRVAQQNHVSAVVFQDRDLILVLFFFCCDWNEKKTKTNNPQKRLFEESPCRKSFDSSLSIMTGLCSVAERRWRGGAPCGGPYLFA